MKTIIAVALSLGLSGCTYLLAHQQGVAIFTAGAAAVQATSGAALNLWSLGEKIDETQHRGDSDGSGHSSTSDR